MTLFTSERELKLEIHGLERNFPSSKVFGNQAAPHFPTTSNRLDHGFCCGGALISRWRWHFGIEGTGVLVEKWTPLPGDAYRRRAHWWDWMTEQFIFHFELIGTIVSRMDENGSERENELSLELEKSICLIRKSWVRTMAAYVVFRG